MKKDNPAIKSHLKYVSESVLSTFNPICQSFIHCCINKFLSYATKAPLSPLYWPNTVRSFRFWTSLQTVARR